MYIYNNGEFTLEEDIGIQPNNRSFRYGDGLFETMRMVNCKIPLFPFHFERLTKGMETLEMERPNNFKRDLNEIIQNLANLNGAKSAKVRLMVYRKGGGLYEPNNNESSIFLECIPVNIEYSNELFSLNETGLNIGLYKEIPKTASIISPYKTNNCLPYIMAALYKKRNNFDECLLQNQYGRIADAIYSNVFIVKSDIKRKSQKQIKLITPSLEEGGVGGVMRRLILEIAREQNIVCEERSIDLQELMNLNESDEVFLTNAFRGIQWVKRLKYVKIDKNYEDLLFSNSFAQQLQQWLIQNIAKKIK